MANMNPNATITPAPTVPAPVAPPAVVRWTLGPASLPVSVTAAPVPAPLAPAPAPLVLPKPDVVVSLAWDAAAQVASVSIPPYDPTVTSKLAEVRAYYLPSGATAPADGPGWVASPYAFETSGDVSGVQVGAVASLGVPPIPAAVADPAGNYVLQVVLGFAE